LCIERIKFESLVTTLLRDEREMHSVGALDVIAAS
jgi:hypothetical protein